MTMKQKAVSGIILIALLGTTLWAFAATWGISETMAALWTSKTEIKTLLEKQRTGQTLTTDEQAKLDAVKKVFGDKTFSKGGKWAGKEGVPMGEGMWGMGMWPVPMMDELTNAEKTALESMSDIQKKEFFDKKRIEMEAKMEAREAVIDKKLNDEVLTDAEKIILAEIKTKRAEMKAKKAEMKAAFEAIKPILDKKQNGETLTTEEQVQLDAFKAKFPHPRKEGKYGRWKGGMSSPRQENM